MMPSAKHFDPVLGVDIHLILTPPGPVVPVPHPFVGMLIDPFDYVPIIGSTITIGGIHRAIAGTAGKATPPHIPIGGTFVKPPANECEMFMGSATVEFDGDAASYAFLPALSCHDVGMIAPVRVNPKKKSKIASMVLPTSQVLPIPAGPPVIIGGPPTISLMALGMRAVMNMLGRAARRLAKTKVGKRVRKAVQNKIDKIKQKVKNLVPSSNKGCGRAGEPIDVVTGANVDEFRDIELVEPVPFLWRRHYHSLFRDEPSVLGKGFRHEYDRSLFRSEIGFEYHTAEGEIVDFPLIDANQEFVAQDGFVLRAVASRSYTVTQVDGTVMEFTFEQGRRQAAVHSLSAPGKPTMEFSYNSAGQLVAIDLEGGLHVDLVYTADGFIHELRARPDAKSVPQVLARYDYDPAGRLIAWTDGLGHRAHYTYDDHDLMTEKADRRGYRFYYAYDQEGRCVDTHGEDGLYAYQFEYFPDSCMTVGKRPDGGEIYWMYNADGVITSIVDPAGGVTSFELDERGRVITETDPAGRVTEYCYNSAGGHTGRIGPTGLFMGPMHLEPAQPDPLARELPKTPLEWELGFALQPSRFSRPSQSDPVLLGLNVASINNTVAAFAEAESSPVDRTRDVLGRPTSVLYSDGTKEKWSYDPSGNVTLYQDRAGRTTTREYQSWNNLATIKRGDASSTRFEYTREQRVTRATTPAGEDSTYLYDQADRLVEVRRLGQRRDRYDYNAAGDLVAKRDAQDQMLVQYQPGPFGAPAVRKLADGDVQQFEFATNGKITAALSSSGAVKLDYDYTGRVILDARGSSAVQHRFGLDHQSTTTIMGRFNIHHRAFLTGFEITDPTGGKHSFEISNAGLACRTLPSGSRELMQFDRDSRCRLKAVARPGAKAPLWQRTFHYSPAGELELISDSLEGDHRFEYDAAGRLTRHEKPSGQEDRYRYDHAGSLLSLPGLSSIRLGAGHQIASTDKEDFRYNQRQHVAERRSKDGLVTRYEYNALDMLVRVTRTSSKSGDAPFEWSAQYDALGRRTLKTWGSRKVEFFWDDDRLAAERHDGKKLRVYIYATARSLAPCLMVDYDSDKADPAAGKVFVIFTNQVGAPIRVEDTQGEIVWQAEMLPYGAVRIRPNASIEMPLRFPGHYHDEEISLHCNGFRYYDPSLGRYIQSDPLGIGGGVNLYAYCDQPLNDVDLNGLHPASRSTGEGVRGGGPNAESPNPRHGPGSGADPFPHSGMTREAFDATRDIAQKHGVRIRVRPSNPDCLPWIRNGHPRKPPHVKNKTINHVDELMGPPPAPGTRGLVGHFKPPSADDAVKNAEKKLGRPLTDAEKEALESRRGQRLKEFNDNDKKIQKLKSVKTDERGVLVDNRANSKTKGKEITGDHDMFDVSKKGPDGEWQPVNPDTDPDLHKKVVDDMRKDPDVKAMHPDHQSWKYDPNDAKSRQIDQDVQNKHKPGGEPLVDFNPDGSTGTSFNE